LLKETENVVDGDDPDPYPGQANGDWFPWFAHPRRVVVGYGLHCDDVVEELVGCGYVIEKGAPYVIPAVVAENASDWEYEGVVDAAAGMENERATGNGNAFLSRNEVAHQNLGFVGFLVCDASPLEVVNEMENVADGVDGMMVECAKGT
jgi:hypothetical protein